MDNLKEKLEWLLILARENEENRIILAQREEEYENLREEIMQEIETDG